MGITRLLVFVAGIAASFSLYTGRATAQPLVNLKMRILPLQCRVEIVSDGMSETVTVSPHQCSRYLNEVNDGKAVAGAYRNLVAQPLGIRSPLQAVVDNNIRRIHEPSLSVTSDTTRR